MADEIRIGHHIFGKAAIDGIAGIELFLAKRFPATKAMAAMAAGSVKPWNADTVAFLDMLDAAAHGGNETDTLMTRNEGRIGFYRPIALGGMKVGMAYAGSLNGNLNLAGTGLRYRHFINRQRFAEGTHDRSFHRLCHRVTPSLSNLHRSRGMRRNKYERRRA